MEEKAVRAGADLVLLDNMDDELLTDAVGIYKVHHSRNLLVRSRLYPSVTEVLEHFRAIPMAVISNKTSEFVQPLLDEQLARDLQVLVDEGLGLIGLPGLVHDLMDRCGSGGRRQERLADLHGLQVT